MGWSVHLPFLDASVGLVALSSCLRWFIPPGAPFDGPGAQAQGFILQLRFSVAPVVSQVSARSWDHNEFFAQFAGDHTLLTPGYSVIIEKLAEGLDIRLSSPVSIHGDGKQWLCLVWEDVKFWTCDSQETGICLDIQPVSPSI